ncbi:MAG: hypothetical protein LUC90_03060 [Lachnospiraceae bacterium]|nr:hypothetical protein [Lachnospiraceae bacterium]
MDRDNREEYGFIEFYFSKVANGRPFADGEEQLTAWQRFADMLCMIALVQKEKSFPSGLSKIGCLLNDEELMKVLEPHEKTAFPERDRVREIFNSLIQRGNRNTEDERVLPLWQFFNIGRLSELEILAFLLALCVDLNRKYERIFGILQEDRENVAKPTAGLVHDLGALFLTPEENQIGILLNRDSFLNRYLLEDTRENQAMSRLSRPLSLRREILEIVLERPMSYGMLAACGEFLETPQELPDTFCQEKAFEELVNIYAAMSASEASGGVIQLVGENGSGRRFLVQTLGTVSAADLISILTGELMELPWDQALEALKLAVSGSVFEHSLIYLEGTDVRPD